MVRVGSRADFLDAVRPEELGVAKVDAVRHGLGETSEVVSAEDLRMAAERLAEDAPYVTVEDLAGRARAARDELEGACRSARGRAARSTVLHPDPPGGWDVRRQGLFDPESARVIIAATDAVVAPRRGAASRPPRPIRRRRPGNSGSTGRRRRRPAASSAGSCRATLRCTGWSSSWLVLDRNTEDSLSKVSLPSGLG